MLYIHYMLFRAMRMGDINMFEPLNNMFRSGTYFSKRPTINSPEPGQHFRYDELSERRKAYSQPIMNLLAREGRYNIITTSLIDFKVGEYVLLQNGVMYTIEETASEEDINPQMSYFFKTQSKHTVLSLIEVSNPLRLQP